MRDWIDVAVLTKAMNAQGGFAAQDAAGLSRFLEKDQEVYFIPPVLDNPRSGRVTSLRFKDRGEFEIHFDTVVDRKTAEALVGSHLLIKEKDAKTSKTSEDYCGWMVYDGTKEIGVIREIEDNPAHPILVVDRGEGRDEVLIPFVSDFIEFS
ncbi:MAG: ribosome maturation factor RimM, partial [Eggerthellaceae bacterium]